MSITDPILATVFAFWPWPELPSVESVRAALQVSGEVSEPDTAPEHTVIQAHWTLVQTQAELPAPLWVWATPAVPLPPLMQSETQRDVEDESGLLHAATWCIGLSTRLDPDDPARTYQRLIRSAVAVSPELPALFDLDALCLRWGGEARRIAAARVPGPPSSLYRVHAVFPDAEQAARGGWVHTHGLRRTGLPDLELLGVPLEYLIEAGRLIDLAVGCALGGGALPEAPVEIVRGHPICFRDAAEVAAELAPEDLGSLVDIARQSHATMGRMAIVDAADPSAAPRGCLRALAEGSPVASVSVRETRRMAARAAETWGRFGIRFVDRGASEDEFLVKLAYETAVGDPEEREHLWFEVLEIRPGRVRARLLNQPVGDIGQRKGDEDWHPLTRLTDWAIHTQLGTIRPHDV